MITWGRHRSSTGLGTSSLAVLEMLIGQLFLVTAVARVVSAWQPAPGRGRSPTEPDSN